MVGGGRKCLLFVGKSWVEPRRGPSSRSKSLGTSLSDESDERKSECRPNPSKICRVSSGIDMCWEAGVVAS